MARGLTEFFPENFREIAASSRNEAGDFPHFYRACAFPPDIPPRGFHSAGCFYDASVTQGRKKEVCHRRWQYYIDVLSRNALLQRMHPISLSFSLYEPPTRVSM